ncbi:MAG: glycosyltransferase family 2 protein, partial [Thermomicrobiales bacterium]
RASAALAPAAFDSSVEKLDGVVEARLHRLRDLLEWVGEGTGGQPSVLDWDSEWWVARRLPGHVVFSPVSAAFQPVLPYLDHSVDVVLMSASRSEHIEEARRVAAWAVVTVDFSEEDPEAALAIEWLREPPSAGLSVSIVIPAFGRPDLVLQCLDAISASTPDRIPHEVIVVDDSIDEETWEMLEHVAPRMPFLRPIRNAENLGFQACCNRGAAAAQGEILIFLNQDSEPLPGWLPPVLALFSRDAAIGAAGSLLLSTDGTLQEAGGIVFRDGSAANFGRGLDLDDPLVATVRDVHYCSAAALATRRDLFERLGGFDARYAPAYYEDTDYCMSVRASGYRVVRQPASLVIHHEGSVNGRDLNRGGKRQQTINQQVFARKWAVRLADFPERPTGFDRAIWSVLASDGLPAGPDR